MEAEKAKARQQRFNNDSLTRKVARHLEKDVADRERDSGMITEDVSSIRRPRASVSPEPAAAAVEEHEEETDNEHDLEHEHKRAAEEVDQLEAEVGAAARSKRKATETVRWRVYAKDKSGTASDAGYAKSRRRVKIRRSETRITPAKFQREVNATSAQS